MKKLLEDINKNNLVLQLIDGKLKLFTKDNNFDQNIIAEIKKYTKELTEFLKQNNQGFVQQAIPKASPAENYPLSSSQYRLWILSQLKESCIAHNMTSAYVFEGEMDHKILDQAFKNLIERHESLRTVFKQVEEGEVRQFILSPETSTFAVNYLDISNETEKEELLKASIERDFNTLFNLTSGPLMLASLYKTERNKWVLTSVIHHIIGDDWSVKLIVDELLTYYNAYLNGKKISLEPLRIQYKDFSVWQHYRLQGENLNKLKTYWLSQLDGELPLLELEGDKVRPAIKTYHGGILKIPIKLSIGKGIKALGQESGATLFMGLLSSVYALLNRYTNQEDIIIGTSVAGRDHVDLEEQVGFYVNLLALRTRFKGEHNFKELLDSVKQVALDAFAHQEYPFNELVNSLSLKKDISRNFLFDVAVVLLEEDSAKENHFYLNSDKLKIGLYKEEIRLTSKFDITFSFVESKKNLDLTIEYNRDVFNPETIQRIGDHLHKLMGVIIELPETPINQLNYIGAKEEQKLLQGFNLTTTNYPKNKTVIDLFQEQVKKTPDSVALVCGKARISYKELDEKSNQLANYLIDTYKIKPEDPIGVMMDRSELTIIAILGALKAGGGYVPIEPDYPATRKNFIVKDTGINVLITQTEYIFDIEFYTGNIVAIDVQLNGLTSSINPPSVSLTPDSLAYIMYTSGSTGQPKGVMIEHKNIARLVKSTNYFKSTGEETLLCTGSISFDATTFEIWSMLLNGGKFVICKKEVLLDAGLLKMEIEQHKVDTMWFTAGWLNQLVDTDIALFKGLKTVLAGGDRLSVSHINKLRLHYPDLRIINGYGPTENTTFSICYEINELKANDKSILLGSPISNTTVYIIDQHGNLSPIGVVGEICVAGDGLARCYLNQPGLTKEKFVPNPFKKDGRMYKTGDLGRWLPDGNIEFIGRKDDQVKIRGYRIELGEVEAVVNGFEGIRSSLVVAWPNENGEKELVAYVTSSTELNSAALKEYIGERLPAYMVPVYYVQLENFSLNSNGKVNRKALPEPKVIGMSSITEYLAPRNEMEKKIVSIWEHLLGREKIGVKDDFFVLGGDSIKILKLVDALRKQLSVQLSVADGYKYSTIESLAEHLSNNSDSIIKKSEQTKAIEEVVRQELIELKRTVLAVLPGTIRDNVEDIYPMSDIEKGMVFESILHQGTGIYHDQLVFRKTFSDFDPHKFKTALELLTEKHLTLRSGFNLSDNEIPLQIVYKKINIQLQFEDLSAITSTEQEERVKYFLGSELAQHPFAVENAPLWRMNVFYTGNDDFLFVWQIHHAIIDGWSCSLFITELDTIYQNLVTTPSYQITPLKSTYKDFIIQQEIVKRDQSYRYYWEKELAGFTRIDLFNNEESFQLYSHYIEKDFLKQIEGTASNLFTTVKIVSLSAYLYLLKILSQQDEVSTGLVTNMRPDCEDGEKILGCFLNTLPFKASINTDQTCMDFITGIHTKLIELKEYEKLSMLQLSLFHNNQTNSSNPFFDVLFNYIDFYAYNEIKGDASASDIEGNFRTNTLMDFTIDQTGNNYRINIQLLKKMKCGFSPEKIGKLYISILNYFVSSTSRELGQFDCISPQEKQKINTEFNNTLVPYSEKKTIHDLFEEQVKRTPDNIALKQGEQTLTYDELNKQANSLANLLLESGIKPGDNVGIRCDRNVDMIIGLYAILKCGAAYVPIDPDYPLDRQNYIISNSNLTAIIVDQNDDLFENTQVIKINKNEYIRYSSENLDIQRKSTELAYTIYTSGSTGRPKGVMITHTSAVNLIEWVNTAYKVTANDRILFITSICFDLSVYDIFGILATGGAVVIATQHEVRDSGKLANLLLNEKITFWDSVPSTLNFLVSELEYTMQEFVQSDLRVVFMSGDWIPVNLPERIKKFFPSTAVVSLGGATEGTVWSNHFLINKVEPSWNSIPYGKPINNNFFYILDKNGKPVPEGITGELHIGGIGVAIGYFNDEEKTKASFVPDPFNKTLGGRMYKTGDLGRMLPDGNMEFLGRKDHQVKIRGFRVELGEIENILLQHPQVKEGLVIAKKDTANNTYLIAYYITESSLSVQEIRAHLSESLPGYMIPSSYIRLEKFPLNTNGKIDRANLPSPDINEIADKIAPKNKLEEALFLLWKALLNKEEIGVTDNFFEIGGHSLLAIQLVSRIRRELNLIVDLRDIFLHTTIIDQAIFLSRSASSDFMEIKNVAEQDSYELSPSQKRLWILSQFKKGSKAYNIPIAFELVGKIEAEDLEKAFMTVVKRHESLRTIFVMEDGDPRQKIVSATAVPFKLHVEFIGAESNPYQTAIEKVEQEAEKIFDLENGPLLHASLLQLDNERYVIVINIHHIVFDGWSVNILITELLAAYKIIKQGLNSTLPPLKIQYKDYSAWINEYIRTGKLERAKNYWIKKLSGELPVLNILTDFPRTPENVYKGETVSVSIDSQFTKRLRDICHQEQCTFYMLFVAIVKTFLFTQSKQEEIIVGSPVAGRNHIDLEDQIGFYVNTIALRSKITPGAMFTDFLSEVKQTVLDAFEHQHYPFDNLVEDLDQKSVNGRNMIFDVLVVLQNMPLAPADLSIEVKEFPFNRNSSKFDLLFTFVEAANEMDCVLEFNSDLYERETIDLFVTNLLFIIESICNTENIPIHTLLKSGKSNSEKIPLFNF